MGRESNPDGFLRFLISIYQLSGRALLPLPVFPGCQLSGNLFALFFYHRKDNHPVFIPKRKPQFNGPFHHFHLTDQPYRFFAEIGIVIRMCLANQKIGQVVDNFL